MPNNIDPSTITWDDDKPDASTVVWDDAPPAAPAAPQPTLGQSAARQGKLLVRALASAAASPFALAGALNPSTLPALGLTSPRLVGEGARIAGMATNNRFVNNEKTQALLDALRRGLPTLTRGVIE